MREKICRRSRRRRRRRRGRQLHHQVLGLYRERGMRGQSHCLSRAPAHTQGHTLAVISARHPLLPRVFNREYAH
jgi:hypothetical protein